MVTLATTSRYVAPMRATANVQTSFCKPSAATLHSVGWLLKESLKNIKGYKRMMTACAS
ncbi:hypothetical protein COCC4DRAFT_58571 [Bipolaris maydis ATCC 48331]|uniref:Uncharacterized protein n=2 Tax=Cochliobolus heterostrophus TaxID=5016 RepID=M2U669_COCH5|nr:uncharacterized protein COCC4DRAFT_58571 [Bipolaris maydis ATCC 48331]EMD94024.1 hypothetical protein COCHEDRAFT_1153334 [Bipolaris maydis C5]ENI07674.1 hypothetical protein COCC4DRAFT_58571 [Bipolaris maydis ATCC 48331]